MERLLGFLRSTRGSAESAMVLLPLLTLFLIGMQISIAVHDRNIQRIHAQDEASKRAISGSFNYGDEFVHIENSGDGQNLDLIVVRKEKSLIDLIPTVLGGVLQSKSIEVDGFAVVESQR
ncbi:hypothetical protein MCEMRE196_00219 [Candidatus Nanopelagicaceae bacterium]